ncbi:MAG: beta-ketoacyl-ACP synthase II [Thermoleophilia bacterium]
MTDPTRRVVVTGMGVVTALGHTVDEFWRRLVAGESGVGRITRFDDSVLSVHIAAEVKGFDPHNYMDKRSARRMDNFSRYAVAAARMAQADSELDVAADPERIGAVIGSGVGGLLTFQEQVDAMREKGADRINPLFIPTMIPNMAAAQVSLELGSKGPLSATCTACAAGSNAIGDAVEIIRRGEAEAMFAGGAEAPICTIGVGSFAAMRALSTRNDDPAGASRPFDRERDGFVIGEGAGVLILEEFDHARRRNAHIYAEVVGYGMSSDSFHLTLPDESGESQARAMTMALEKANVRPDEVQYLNAHGTSTQPGDSSETRAIKSAFGAHAGKLAISSTKSMIGHCLGASGAIEAVATVLTIELGVIPPTINLSVPDPDCDLDYVPNVARPARVDVAASNSFGFGGHDVTLILRRCEE